MAFQSAQSTRASVGLLNASGYIRDLSHTGTTEALDVTTLADRAKVFIVGQQGSSGSFNMVLDTLPATNSQFAVLNTWKSTQPQVLDIAPEGYTSGNPVIMINAIDTQVTTQAQVGATVDASVAFLANSETDYGLSVEDYSAITVDTSGTARDQIAQTANGGVAHLHVSAFSGLTSDVIIIEHSSTGVGAWTTLVTFTTVTGLTSERVVVAAGTTVKQFLRIGDDVTGTGSITRQISFGRR